MASYLITGTSRGIGLELVKQLSELPNGASKIFAITRGPSKGLQQIIDSSNGKVVNVVIEDITKEDTVQKGVAEVEKILNGKGLDILVNNAGVSGFTPGGTPGLSSKDLLETLNTNVVSAHVMTASFLPLLQKGKDKKIVNISTTLGSISRARDYQFAPTPAYKISKAAMNMLTAQYALDLESKGFTVIAVSPGWLKTDLGSQGADLPAETGVKSVVDIIGKADRSKNGKFLNVLVPGWENVSGPNFYDGKEVPW